jgi:hypothetical protein
MEVRQEHDPKIRDIKSSDAPVEDRSRCAPDDAWTRIHEVRGVVYHDRRSRS